MLLGKQNLMTGLIVGALAVSAGAQARKRDLTRADERQAGPSSAAKRTPVDYLSGEVNVAVSGNQNPVIKLGLSPNGATIIEFPASDKLFNIIPGNSNLVTVEESPTKETDRFVIVRPGDGFASPTTMAQAERAPVSSVMVQMTSGLVITFLFYQVPQLAEQAHRVVVTYDRNEVIAARRASGLAVNLDSGVAERQQTTTSLRVVPTQNIPQSAAAPSQPPEDSVPKSAPPEDSALKPRPQEDLNLKKGNLGSVASEALSWALNHPEGFKTWSNDRHGLSISVLPVNEVDGRSQAVVFAVRNNKKPAARLVPGQPEINIETVNDEGKLVTVDQVKKLAEKTTAMGSLIPGKATEYYSIVYESPIIGAKQRLRVAVGITTAADEPSTALLNDKSRKH
jgi:hypothetical protein